MAGSDLDARLMRLAAMLDRSAAPDPALDPPTEDPVVAHVESVRDARLRTFEATLKQRLDEPDLDAGDALLLRLLFDEYVDAVRHVRAAARIVDRRLAAAHRSLREAHRRLEDERARSTPPPDSR